MNWFHRLCRQSGLLVHDLTSAGKQKTTVSQTTQERKPQPGVTIRKTTIEEIEIEQGTDIDPDKLRDNNQ